MKIEFQIPELTGNPELDEWGAVHLRRNMIAALQWLEQAAANGPISELADQNLTFQLNDGSETYDAAHEDCARGGDCEGNRDVAFNVWNDDSFRWTSTFWYDEDGATLHSSEENDEPVFTADLTNRNADFPA